MTFLFSIHSSPGDDALELVPCEPHAITEPMWAELAGQMGCEPGLLPCPAATLARRAEQGYAAVAVAKGRIVSHVALAPLGCRDGSLLAGPELPSPRPPIGGLWLGGKGWGRCPAARPPARTGPGRAAQRARGQAGAPHTWGSFCAASGLGAAPLPSIDVYDCAGSWTAPAWRGKGVSMALHRPLLQHWLVGGNLGLSGLAGTTSPRLGQLGWQILGWSATPFLSSLTGIPLAGFEDWVRVAWQLPAGLARYDGPPLDPCDPSQAWSHFCYFCVSDPASARRLDGQLAELCQGDLYLWRRAVLEVFGQPDAWHRLALLP